MITVLRKTIIATVTALATMMSLNAAADTLNFSELPRDVVLTTPAVLSNATITSSTGDTYIDSLYSTNGFGAICGADGSTCEADLNIQFDSTIENLSFSIHGYGGNDSLTVMGYLGATLVNTVSLTDTPLLDISAWGQMDRLFLDYDGSDDYGYAFSDFDFTTVTAVPLPAALPLFGAALMGLGYLSRRRKQQ
ncbi:MAG: VPLPA-CTERM sorting domain-containing protein [Desulfobacterales bacterium]|nr:VPLPA-CTERM sorting domain-containing protein [Desulfobacterales bacterium]